MLQRSKDASLEYLIGEIRQHHAPFKVLASDFRKRIGEFESISSNDSKTRSGLFWKNVAFADSLERIRLLLEHNFICVETLGVLAVSRYLFELTVWLKLLQADSRYGLVYYHELLNNQIDFYKSLQINAQREIAFLRRMDAEEKDLMAVSLSEALGIPNEQARNEALREMSARVMQRIDNDAARRFSLYGEQAKTNGYGFQAYLVEESVLTSHSKALAEVEQQLSEFKRQLAPEIEALMPRRWNWRAQAKEVQMEEEYDFIYVFASLLMHAKPSSLTTDQKNLEHGEMLAFLRYIRVRLADMTQMAEDMLASPVFLQ